MDAMLTLTWRQRGSQPVTSRFPKRQKVDHVNMYNMNVVSNTYPNGKKTVILCMCIMYFLSTDFIKSYI